MAVPFPKIAQPTRLTRSRDVGLEEPPAKAFGVHKRRFILLVVQGALAQSQFGSGMNVGSIEIACISQSAAVETIVLTGRCVAAFYVDIASALAKVKIVG